MASSRSSSGYNNPGYCNQYDYDQLARHAPQMGTLNQTYIANAAIDNYCYEEDEEIQLSNIVTRQQSKQLVREPPIGASTTYRITETRSENIASRSTVIPTSPKQVRQNGAYITPGRGRHDCRHRNEGTIMSPRTPKKNVPVIITSTPRKTNATQTYSPRRTQSLTSPRKQKQTTSNVIPLSPISTPRKAKSPVRNVKYVIESQNPVLPQRNTAIISPIYTSCANTSVISTTSSTPKKEPFLATGVMCRRSPVRLDISPGLKASWIHIPTSYQTPPTATIVTAAFILLLCGAATAILCLYMMSQIGRLYYLDFGALSGLGSILLGCLGFRSRRWQWLPNRNYVSGYIVLSMFSLLSCVGLVVIMTVRPKPGEPLADVAGGAVCGIAALSLILAIVGIMSSRCCKYPPPDNRVEHCAEGFTL